MEKIKIDEGCIACGICFEITELIIENNQGEAEVDPLLEINESNRANLRRAIDECPENCLSIEEIHLVKNEGIEGIMELKKLIHDIYNSYNGCLPPKDEYRFNKKDYSINYSTDFRGTRQYIYKSSEKADQAALKEFNRVMYSQKKALIQGVVVEYVAKKIKPYLINTSEKGDFLYEANKRMYSVLKEIILEAKHLTDSKISLPKDIEAFDILVKESSLQELKDTYQYIFDRGSFENKIDRELESLDWYDSTMTNDDKDEYNSKGDWKRSKYCYTGVGIAEACKEFADDIITQTYYVIDDYDDGIDDHLKRNLRYCFRDMKDALLEKFKIIMDELDRFLPEEQKGNTLPRYSSDIAADCMNENSEGLLLKIYNQEYDQLDSGESAEKQTSAGLFGIGSLSTGTGSLWDRFVNDLES